MQIRSFRGSGEPAWVIASSNARDGLGPDPRRALGPAAVHAASTGRTRDRTRPTLQQRQKVLAKAPSTRDPKRKSKNVTDGPSNTGSTALGFGKPVNQARNIPGSLRRPAEPPEASAAPWVFDELVGDRELLATRPE